MIRIFTPLLVSLLFVACNEVDPVDLPSLGTLERERLELSAESFEPIVEIAVREGDRARAGDLLVRLDSSRLDIAIAQAQARRDAADANLRLAVRGPRSERILEGRARLAAAEGSLAAAKSQLDRSRTLVAENVETAARLDIDLGRHEEAQGRRDEARSALEAMLEGTTVEELDLARSSLDAADAALDQLDLDRSRLELRAPTTGVIDALPFEVGERAPIGSTLVVLLSDGNPYARVHVPAQVRVGLEPENRAEVKVDGQERTFSGQLRWISSQAAFTPYYALTQHDRGRLSYLAEVDLGEDASRLPIGVPVEVFFLPKGASHSP